MGTGKTDAAWALSTAGAPDLPAIMSLERAGFPAGITESEEVFASRLAAFPEGFFILRNAIPPGNAAVPSTDLDGGGGTFGYACTEIWKERGDYDAARFALGHDVAQWHDPNGDELYLASMTIAPALRGKGAGHFLFRETLRAMREAFPKLQRAVLVVNEAWPAAVKIYRSADFIVAERLPAFFHPEGKPPQAALVMEKEF